MESLAPGTIEPSTLSPVTANGLQEKRRFNANGEPEAAAVGVYGTPEQKTIEQKKKKKLKKRDRKSGTC